MTFTDERTFTTTAGPDAVWSVWSDVTTWPVWDPPVLAVDLPGAFEAGAEGTMTLVGDMTVPLVLEVVEEGRRYLDRLTMGELVVRVDHVVEPGPAGGSRITVSTVIEGPGADGIGPMVVQDAPVATRQLVEMVEGRA